jgi:putative ABC transport system substrate-binding protein
MIVRRAVLSGVVGGLLAASRVVTAQPAGKVHRVGLLLSGPATSPSVDAFKQGLHELGWVEGQNLTIEQRLAEGDVGRLPALAAELVRLKVDVIAAGPTPPAIAAKNATGTIPIVMLGAAEPVKLGLVASLAHPGGNVTGVAWSVDLEVIAKGLELLREASPRVRRVAVLWNPAHPAQGLAVERVKHAARTLGTELLLQEARGPEDFDAAFAAMAKRRADALMVVADALFVVHRTRLAELEARYRLPSMHGLRANVEAGGLMSYGPNIPANWRRAASFVDRILKGARPADLPVEQPTQFDLVINLKTAKALGLTIPPSLLLRADQVVE